MGASQSSSRTFTVENEDPVNVLKVSDAVVERLKGNIRAEQEKLRSVPVQEPLPSRVLVQPLPPIPSPHVAQSAEIGHLYYGVPLLSAAELRRQKELELGENDRYWQRRIAQLEQQLQKTDAIMKQEYERTIEEINNTFVKAPPSYQLPPCREMGSELMQCYQKNAGQPLNCTSVVQSFSKCVDAQRVQRLSAKA